MAQPILLLQCLGIALSLGALSSAIQLNITTRDHMSLSIGSCELEQALEISRHKNDKAFLIIGDISLSRINLTC